MLSKKEKFSINIILAYFVILAALCPIAAHFIFLLKEAGLGNPSKASLLDVFFYFLVQYESVGLLLSASFCFIFFYIICYKKYELLGSLFKFDLLKIKTKSVIYISIAVTLIVCFFRYFFYYDYDVCIDESLSHFQSLIFLSGHLYSKIQADLIGYVEAAKLPFTAIDYKRLVWTSSFLPINSIVRMPLALVHLDGYTNALLLGFNIIFVYFLLNRIWPVHPVKSLVGIILFIASPQVIVLSMTSFAMELHALLITAWLYCYLSDNRKIFSLTPWIGVLSMGAHQPHIHLILAGPFVVRLIADKKWLKFLYFSSVYIIGSIFWMWYMTSIRSNDQNGNLLSCFKFDWVIQIIVQTCNLILLLNWTTPIFGCLLVCGFWTIRNAKSVVVDSFLSVIMLFVFYFIWPYSQGHGWGYRFFYPAMPLALIVAVHGCEYYENILGENFLKFSVCLSVLLSIFIQYPFRLNEVRDFVGKNYKIYNNIKKSEVDIVLIENDKIWYGSDFTKNDPFLRDKPLILSLTELNCRNIRELSQTGWSIRIFGKNDAKELGYPAVANRRED